MISWYPGADLARCRDDWQSLLKAHRAHPRIGARIPLEEASRAYTLLEERAVTGKVGLTI